MMGDGVELGRESPAGPESMALLAALDAHLMGLYPAESNHILSIEELCAANVAFLVARVLGVAVGCGALVDHGDYGELKRMFVVPQARGRRIGRRLVEALQDRATELGLRVLRLETGIHQPEALALYERAGYTRRGSFGDYPDDPLSVFMEKQLGD